jgi:hypothetical protein
MTTGVESARAVLDVARLLEESISAGGEPDAYALEALERVAVQELEGVEAAGRQGFESFGTGTDEERLAGAVDCLTAAFAQVSIGNTLLAAGKAAGEETGAADPAQFSAAVSELADTADVLDAVGARDAQQRQGFEAGTASPSVDAAVEQLRATAERVSEQIAGAAAATVTAAIDESIKLVPEKWRDAAQKIGDKFDLGEHAGRLVRLGLRAVRRALELFTRLFPADALTKARDQVQVLYDRLASKEPAPATVGWMIGVEDVREYLKAFTAGTAVDRLDLATAEVERLGAKFTDVGELATGLVKGIALAGALVGGLSLVFASFGVPHLALVMAGALAVVVAGVLLFAMDYVGDRPVLGTVRGVKLVVADTAG